MLHILACIPELTALRDEVDSRTELARCKSSAMQNWRSLGNAQHKCTVVTWFEGLLAAGGGEEEYEEEDRV